jgi:opacity protein-like surface antigen
LLGGGALVFNPTNTLIGGNPQEQEGLRQTRPAVLYGGGVDYHLISFLALRLQYRGLFYSPPDFWLPGLFTGGRGHLAEPVVGLVVRF